MSFDREAWLAAKEKKESEESVDQLNQHEWKELANTSCVHEWVLAPSDPNSDMASEVCAKCWSGRSVPRVPLDR